MTLIIAMKYNESVLVATDGQVTYGDTPLIREEEPKVEALGNFAITGAGLSGPLDRIIKTIKNSIRTNSNLTFDEILEIRETLCGNIMKNMKRE